MERELESKMEKLVSRYLEAQAQIEIVRPQQLPSARRKRRIQRAVHTTFSNLHATRGGPASSLIKLAYVRGMRSVNPESRMEDVEIKEVEALQRRLDNQLTEAEAEALRDFRAYLRSLGLSELLSEQGYPEQTLQAMAKRHGKFPLEQRARTSIRSITQEALDRGASRAEATTRYDSGENVSR